MGWYVQWVRTVLVLCLLYIWACTVSAYSRLSVLRLFTVLNQVVYCSLLVAGFTVQVNWPPIFLQ